MKNKSLSLFVLSTFAFVSTMSAETYTQISNGTVLENQTVQNTLLWKGGGVDGVGNVYIKGENTVLGSDGYDSFKISGGGGKDYDVNFVFDNEASITYAKSAFAYNDYYTDISYNVANDGDKATAVFESGTTLSLDANPADATDTRTVTIGKGITAQFKSDLNVKSSATNTTNKFIVNGTVDVAGTFGSNGNSIWEINGGTLKATYDFSDKQDADGGGAQITVDNGGSISLRNIVIRENSSLNVKNGTVSINSFETKDDMPSSLTIGKNGVMTTKSNVMLGIGTTADIEGELNIGDTFYLNKTTENGGNAVSLSIAEGASVNITNGMTVYQGSTVNVAGKLNIGGHLLLEKDNDGKIEKPVFTIASTADITAQSIRTRATAINLVSGSKLTINNNTSGTTSFVNAAYSVVEKDATFIINTTNDSLRAMDNHNAFIINGRFEAHGGKYLTCGASGIRFNSDDVVLNTNLALGNSSDIYGGKITVGKNVTLNAENAAILQSIQTKVGTTTKNNSYLVLEQGSTSYFKGIAFEQSDEDLKLTITLNTDAKLILTDFINNGGITNYGTLDAGDTIVINNFAENSIGIKNHIASDDTLLSQISAEGVDQLYWVKDDIANVWWLSANPAVPEPAEWAMIFGGIALGLAIYRRRK